MNVALAMIASVLLQAVMTVTFFHEALTTKQGNYCQIKCTAAGLLYLGFASLLVWLLFTRQIP
ncbi:hypothetical protein [Spirosoma radiotolerans]|uniref:Uncharacterized protein n=1 Tax=Spirosoma radiotolerans TaxID=1379870 RepID=A0A0E3ZVX4_9BACT|nr:hypothetical protein [Spirosoma radiotolerans]AKD56053.1 hypothetical protein SD10_15270 [Spirosoma radiotolerans]